MAGDRRVRAGEQAERVNAAADLLEAGVPAAEAARVLAGRFGVSARQARRYADRARASGRAEVPGESVVFTVKLPAALAERVRAHASQAPPRPACRPERGFNHPNRVFERHRSR